MDSGQSICNKNCDCHSMRAGRGCNRLCRKSPSCNIHRLHEKIRLRRYKSAPEYKKRQHENYLIRYSKNKKEMNNKIVRGNFERKNQLTDILGGKCVRCGIEDRRCLHLDHINGGGSMDLVKHGSSQQMVRHYLKDPDYAKKVLQVLCANCNWIKEYEKWHKFI